MNLKERNVGNRELVKKVLIVCEGARTEPEYFKQFKVSKKCEVVGAGCNTISVVKRAIFLMNEKEYSEVWCVFDRDSFKKDRVKGALTLARANDIKLAFSNESFELWYVLHFIYLDTKVSRKDYINILNGHIGKEYKKNDSSMYQLLLPRQKEALSRARKLKTDMLHPGMCEHDSYPYTTVFELVERLNALGRTV